MTNQKGSVIIGSFLLILAVFVAFIGYLGFKTDETFGGWIAVIVALFLVFKSLEHYTGNTATADDGNWRTDPASRRQKSFADELGIDYKSGISKGELSDLIDEAKEARK